MFRRVTLLALFSMLFLSFFGCSAPPEPAEDAAETEAAPALAPVEEVPLYELTKDDITSHPDWTSRNITVLGVKLGDRTRDVEKNFGSPLWPRPGEKPLMLLAMHNESPTCRDRKG